jgi:hypothetical protein
MDRIIHATIYSAACAVTVWAGTRNTSLATAAFIALFSLLVQPRS